MSNGTALSPRRRFGALELLIEVILKLLVACLAFPSQVELSLFGFTPVPFDE
jgi:hypothetical protein